MSPQKRSRDMSRDYFSSQIHFLSQIQQVSILSNAQITYPFILKPSNTKCRSTSVNLCKRNPPGYTNLKEISEIPACPHFNSRQHENKAETKTSLKHVKFSKLNTVSTCDFLTIRVSTSAQASQRLFVAMVAVTIANIHQF